MNDGDLLLRAICADPCEDTPRLMYADYLQGIEQDEYAAFIRTQLTHPYLTGTAYSRESGYGTISEASPLRFFESLWAIPGLHAVFIDRGFVASISIHPNSLLENASVLFAMQPITLVQLTGKHAVSATWWNEKLLDDQIRNPQSVIPCDLMPDPTKRRNNFPNITTAIEALSRRCVDYGREKAELPPLLRDKL